MHLANLDEITGGRALAASTVILNIATVATLSDIQQFTHSSSITFRDVNSELADALAVIPLRAAAAPDLAAGEFDGVNPPPTNVAMPREPVIAILDRSAARAATNLGARA